MPELPEVETVRRGLERLLPGTSLDHVELRRNDLRWPIPVAAVCALQNSSCIGIDRRAKYLLIHFGGKRSTSTMLVHLGMSGRLFADVLDKGDEPDPWRPHEHWRMTFCDRGRRLLLRYVDPRRFGSLDVARTPSLHLHERLAHLGPEPFDDAFGGPYLHQRSRGRTSSTKSLLMDSRVVVGVGNIYASEACFRAGVRPGRAAGSLTRPACENLVGAVRETLADAIKAGGTTLRDYVGVDENTGYFQRELAVYGRAGESCRTCGDPIRHRVMQGRATYWCRVCQR